MRTFSIITLGCKINQYESQQIREFLEKLGLRQADAAQEPDLVVVNTCCVTHNASAKSRQYIRRARKLSPDAPIAVAGCLPRAPTGELSTVGNNVFLISYRNDLATTLAHLVNGKSTTSDLETGRSCQYVEIKAESNAKVKAKNNLAPHIRLPQLTSFKGHTRAFLKVQDGCDGHCSYCIVPKTRPVVRSKPVEAVLQEARALVEAGHKEIVVTGVFLGAYGQTTVRRKDWEGPQNDKLADLLDRMTQIPGLARIRLSSLEPADISSKLIDTFCKHCNIALHLHLSLQSGSDGILQRMRRQYNAEDFRGKVDLIKSRLDRPAITTDIMVGFPGETDDDFEQTVDLARETGFAKMHIFRFSARKGTAAANMQDTVDNRVIKKRAQILRDLDIELGIEFRRQFVGETATVLLENGDAQVCGRSDRYFMVYVENGAETLNKNDLVRVKLVRNSEKGAIGQALAVEG